MIDPWDKAAECDLALEFCADAERRFILVNLRELWIHIGNERAAGMTDWVDIAAEVTAIHDRAVPRPDAFH
jgi:hypothetical protein